MEKMKLISKDSFFYSILLLFAVFLGQFPIIARVFHTPPGYYYPLLDGGAFSDFYYMGLIRWGMGDGFLLTIPYVIAPHQASFIQIIFVILGKLSLITGIGPAEMLNISRIGGGIIYGLSAIFLFKTIFSARAARLAFILFLFAQPIPTVFNEFISSDFSIWVWNFHEAARRIGVQPPHYTVGRALAIFSLVFLLRFMQMRKKRDILFSTLFIFIAGIIYPPPAFVIAFSLVMTICIYLVIRSRSIFSSFDPRILSAFGLFFLGCVLSLLLLKMELAKGFPWNRWNEVELGWNAAEMKFELVYIRILSFLVILLPLAIGNILVSRINFWKLFFVIWSISAFLLFPFADILSVGKFRFAEGAQIVGLTVVVTWFLERLWLTMKESKYFWIAKIMRLLFFILFIGNFLIFSLLVSYDYTMRLWNYWTNTYFRPNELSALHFVNTEVKKDSVILADVYPSNYIPSFARVKTIVGYPDFYKNSVEFESDKNAIEGILSSDLSADGAKSFIKSKNVDYVYREYLLYKTQEIYPSFMTRIYQNDIIEIYKIKR